MRKLLLIAFLALFVGVSYAQQETQEVDIGIELSMDVDNASFDVEVAPVDQKQINKIKVGKAIVENQFEIKSYKSEVSRRVAYKDVNYEDVYKDYQEPERTDYIIHKPPLRK